MKVYYSNRYDTLLEHAPGLHFFEDLFPNKTWNEYPECWRQLIQNGEVETIKCKTRDAILSIPASADVYLVRVGQAVVGSRKGEIIETPCPMDVFLMLETSN